MELVESSAFWIGLLKIVWVNIMLSGDNVVVIALASHSLPSSQQKKAVIFGSAAAIVLRVILTIFAVQLLQLPWLKAMGAVLLVWIGIQLLTDDTEERHFNEASNLISAIKIIVVADLVMSLDNVLAVAAAADNAPPQARLILVALGLGLSIPVVIFGSGIVLKLMKRFPMIVTLGAMLIGWIAGEMLAKEEIVAIYTHSSVALQTLFSIAGALFVLAIGKFKLRRIRSGTPAPGE